MFREDTPWEAAADAASLHDALFGSPKQNGVANKSRRKRQRKGASGKQEEDGEVKRQKSDETAAVTASIASSQDSVTTSSKKRRLRKLRRKQKNEDQGVGGPVEKDSRITKTSEEKESTTLDEESELLKQKKSKRSVRAKPKVAHEAKDNNCSSSESPSLNKTSRTSSHLYSKMSSKLDGSRFRMINEQLYTSTGAEAKAMFEGSPELFQAYHKGFATQVSKWEINPLDHIIAYIRTLPSNTVIADMGCGEAVLAQSVPHTVHSFDLVATNDHVTACDMAHTHLESATVDVCIFCLSLMGSNVTDFILEARRILKKTGVMRICEVVSRFKSIDSFVKDVEAFGFRINKRALLSKMFIELIFLVVDGKKWKDCPNISLQPCIYKRR